MAIAGDDVSGLRPKKVTAERLAEGREWLATAPKTWPSICRMAGPANEAAAVYAIPTLRIEQAADVSYVDLAVPWEDAAAAAAFGDTITGIVRDMPLLCGVMGMGFALPASFDSLASFFPRAYPRYRTAIEFMVDGPRWGIHREIGNAHWHKFPEARDGIADVGWRTFVGDYYLPRLPELDAVADAPVVTLERHERMAILTAGAVPIWGDVNADEDISAYRAVAAALAPVRMHIEPALSGLFGSQRRNPEGRDRVEGYLARYD
ncbi:MAG: DUF3396 domain-containing protein [Symploca sp. SIO2G7]|nr:DUF3396 domain-containing protein [Symploca sp. SIO2G7]